MIYKGIDKALVINQKKDVSIIEFTWEHSKIKAVIDTRKRSLTSLSCYNYEGKHEDIGDFCQLGVESFIETLKRFGLNEELNILSKEIVLF